MLIFIEDAKQDGYFKFFTALQKPIETVTLDTETTGLDPHTDRMLLLQIGIKGDVFIFDVARLGVDLIKTVIKSLIQKNATFIAHNAKFDIKIIKKETDILLTNVHDTLTVEAMLNAGIGETLYSLHSLVEKYCGVVMDKTVRNEFIGMEFGTAFNQNQITYAGTDVLYLDKIYVEQLIRAAKAQLNKIYEIEMRLVPVVAMMEYIGIKIDKQKWIDLEKSALDKAIPHKNRVIELIINSIDFSTVKNGLELADKLLIKEPAKTKRDRAALEMITDPQAVRQWAMENFNTESNQQMKNGLELTGLKVESTNEKVLNKLPRCEVIDSLLAFREYNKLASTYGSNIADQVNPVTGRIHTDYFNIGAATGRFSSRGPNLQNIPSDDDYRSGFISEIGFSFINMDYSQQEFRLAGATSGEQRIIDAYIAGADMHTATAAIIYKKDLKDITKAERSFGKTVNFAILYGTTKWGLKRNLNISMEEAEEIIQKFYDGYPTLSHFKDMAEKRILELGYSVTPLGRRRYFPPKPTFATPFELERWEAGVKREGFNHIIQGGGADVTKIALNNLFYNNPFGDKFRLVLQVHDEIGAEVHDSILNDAIVFMEDTMKSSFQPLLRGIPAMVEYKTGKYWKH